MKQLRTFYEKDLRDNVIIPDDIEYFERHAVRAVLRGDAGRIALLHGAVQDYYKLPGGGIEEGEDILAALERELLEEVGAQVSVGAEIGRIEQWRVFEDGHGFHQTSDAYLATVKGDIGLPEFTDDEIEEGFSLYWASDIFEARKLVANGHSHDDVRVRSMTLRDYEILSAAEELQ